MAETCPGETRPTGRYRNILVAFDGSDSSKNALKEVLRIAKIEEFRVTAVTVLRSYDSESAANRIKKIEDARGADCNICNNSVKIVIEDSDEVQTILEEGIVHEAIIEAAEARCCDLIIMGRRGLSRFERAFMGSVTAQVIRHSPIDVLVMPRNTSLGWKNILLATDGSEFSASATERAIEVAQEHGGELGVVSVVDVSDNFYNEMPGALERMEVHTKDNVTLVKDAARILNIEIKPYIREGEPHKEIVKLAREINADVICMGSHGRTGLERILMGSVAEQVLQNAPCPILIVKS